MAWERVNEGKDFCRTYESVISGTNVDSQGDKLTLGALKGVLKDMKQNPEKRLMNYRHRTDEPPIGEIVSGRIEKKADGEHYLIAKIGIYQEREEIAEEIENGELGGYSISFRNFYNIKDSEGKKKDKIGVVALPGKHKQEIVDKIQESDTPVELVTQKSAEAQILIGFLESNPDLVLELLILIWGWYQGLDEEIRNSFDIEAEFSLGIDLNFDIQSRAKFRKQAKKELEEVS